MANPTKYHPSYSFGDFQGVQPSTPLPGVQVDAQFADIEQSIGQTVDALANVRRSDGALVNGIVTKDSLAPGLVDQLTAQTGSAAVLSAAAAAEASATEAVVAANEAKAVVKLAGDFVNDWGDWSSPVTGTQDWGDWS